MPQRRFPGALLPEQPHSRDTTAMALAGVPAPMYPTPQESHSPGPCSHTCPIVLGILLSQESCSPGIPFPRGPVSIGSNSHRGPAPMEVPAHPCPCVRAVLLYVCAVCPAVYPSAHPCPYSPAVLAHVCTPLWLMSVCPCRLRMPCVRHQPACQHLTCPSDARDLGTFTSLFSPLASCHRQHHPHQ